MPLAFVVFLGIEEVTVLGARNAAGLIAGGGLSGGGIDYLVVANEPRAEVGVVSVELAVFPDGVFRPLFAPGRCCGARLYACEGGRVARVLLKILFKSGFGAFVVALAQGQLANIQVGQCVGIFVAGSVAVAGESLGRVAHQTVAFTNFVSYGPAVLLLFGRSL